MTAPVRLADLLAGLSVATDLGMGRPPEESMRSSLIGASLARRMGLAERQVRDALYTTLLLHVGCTAYAHEAAAVFRNEIALNEASTRTNFLDPRDMMRTFLPGITADLGRRDRVRVTAYALVRGNSFGRRANTAVCEVGRLTARRLGLGEAVQQGLFEIFECWNGKGNPRGLKGEESAIEARLARAATTASVFAGIGGAELAVEALEQRAGGMLDPGIVEVFTANAPALVAEASTGDPRELILDAEPEPVAYRSRDQLPDVAAAFGDLADLKTPFTHGHSPEVARLAAAAAERSGLDAAAVSQVRLAGLLHDLGRIAISTAVWEKPGPLSAAEWDQVKLHPYHSERILARSRSLEPVAPVAGMHHERLDGSGYHRGCSARDIPITARLLAAADVYQAMTQPRPHREARGPGEAAEELKRESRAGRLDPDAVSAVLEAAGGRERRRRSELRPAGLSEREVEVLGLVAEGLSNAEIADRLVISQRTAEHHVQHIYAKIGESSRAAAAVFALQHDLLAGGS